jgi:hypothetical protein
VAPLSFDGAAWLAGWQQAILLGTGFGLLHAFDADHLATIGGLAVNDRALSPAGYALRWAAGHGAALAVVALLALGLNLAEFADWASHAELLVAAALVAIGVETLTGVRLCTLRLPRRGPSGQRCQVSYATRARAALRNEPDTHATALHNKPDTNATPDTSAEPHVHFFAPRHTHARVRSGRAGLLLGVLHGGAGSAAVLALLPLARFHGVESGVYLACFSAGVALGALAFAQVFAAIARRSLTAGARVGAGFGVAIGVLAVASGIWLLIETLHGGA